ncbi:hypothetical protein PENTCL1PPCAC_8902, partial [Pristionchus entomophagus]
SSDSTIENNSNSRAERIIWYRESSGSVKTGPFPLDEVSSWYERCQILPSAEFIINDGASWIDVKIVRPM